MLFSLDESESDGRCLVVHPSLAQVFFTAVRLLSHAQDLHKSSTNSVSSDERLCFSRQKSSLVADSYRISRVVLLDEPNGSSSSAPTVLPPLARFSFSLRIPSESPVRLVAHFRAMRETVPLFLLLFITILPHKTFAHVAFTFPEARYPPLDFLDTARTVLPCGVPKPPHAKIPMFFLGEKYNFTWRMQYPHQGGYRITLIDQNFKLVEQLAPAKGDNFTGLDDQTAQTHTVQFTKPCSKCTVVLERQALEWGSSYRFHSCADVAVVEPDARDERNRCTDRGEFVDGKCVCEGHFSGDRCQYKNDCSSDADCLNGGKCVEEYSSLIKKTCYCAFGFFGVHCDRSFDGPEDDMCFNYKYGKADNKAKFDEYGLFNKKCYKKAQVNPQDFIYSRVIDDEVEIIMDYQASTWVSIGWRPLHLDPSCRLFPDLESSSRAKRGTERVFPMVSTNSTDDDSLPKAVLFEEIDTKIPAMAPPDMPRSNGFVKTAIEAPLHPMDCTDIIVGSVRDGRSRINDMYTRDRSTPLIDSWFDGEDSLSAAYGIEQDGRTVVMFRRKIAEIEPSDHPLGPDKMFVIWAKGQEPNQYRHSVKSAIETGKIKDKDFYRVDQLKYHGSINRGVYPMEFVPKELMPQRGRPFMIRRPKPTTTAAPVSVHEVEPKIETMHETKPVPKIQEATAPHHLHSQPAQPQSPTNTTPQPEPKQVQVQQESGRKSEPEPRPQPRPEPRPEPEPEPTPRPQSRPEPEPEPEPRLRVDQDLKVDSEPASAVVVPHRNTIPVVEKEKPSVSSSEEASPSQSSDYESSSGNGLAAMTISMLVTILAAPLFIM
uniref:EGF-like domain-containing protein n=1 Tax=Steinernema glaseri TaxID=37863 RepID=A0A1I7YK48_9BILA